jgi:hypothetical protein
VYRSDDSAWICCQTALAVEGFLKTISLQDVAERLYDWSLREASSEFERNYAFVDSVRGANAEKYVRFFRQLNAPEVPLASQALVKRMNQPVLLGKKAVLSNAEDTYVRAYLQFEEIAGPNGMRVIQADQSTATWTVELRKASKSLVKERFRAEPGALESLSANEWIHEVDVGCLRINTWLDFGGRSSMSYSHRLSLRDGEPLSAHISLLQWLGAASMTRWRALRAEELMNAADAVLVLSQYFIRRMTTLFAE